MSVPSKNRSLLSQTEKDRLKNPPNDANIKKRNNLIVKEKIKRWLNDANDICFALDHLKDTKIEGVFPDQDIFAVFGAIEKLLDRLDFAPVEGEPQHPVISRLHIVTGKDWKKNKDLTPGAIGLQHRRATPADLERNWQLEEFVKFLGDHYPNKSEERSPAYKKYRDKRFYEVYIKEQSARMGFPAPMWFESYDSKEESQAG